jgi:hypothetical protein
MRWDDIHEARETIRKQDEALRSLRDQRRERIAAAALAGLMSRECDIRFQGLDNAAQEALFQADSLIALLDAKTEPK